MRGIWMLHTYRVGLQHVTSVATTVKMNCRCSSVGFKLVNIIWQAVAQDTNLEPSYYRVMYTQQGQYQLGCTLNTTHQSSKQKKELQCSIRSKTPFDPYGFYFVLEMRNSSGFFSSGTKTCRLASNVECSKPQNVKVVAKGKRNLFLSWEPSEDMGNYALFLCYKILYASSLRNINESTPDIISDGETSLFYTFDDLNPFTKYTFYIQCSLPSCVNGWGALSGPVTAMTAEGVPAKAPQFENWSISSIEDNRRDVIVVWNLPPSSTWNGVLKKFAINYWQVLSQENDSLISVPNSSKILQINDGSARKATLAGLNRFVDYETEISMCTSKGCGPKSSPWVFGGEVRNKDISNLQKVHTSNNAVWWVTGTVPAVVFVVVVILSVVAYKRCKNRQRNNQRNNRQPLEEALRTLDVEPHYDDPNESVPSTQNSYADIRLECIQNDSHPDRLRIEEDFSRLDT